MWLGGDSAATGDEDSEDVWPSSEPKVWRQGDCMIGVAGDGRVASLIRHTMAVPALPDDMAPAQYMTDEFVESLRDVLVDNGSGLDETDVLVAVGGGLFVIDDEYDVTPPLDPYIAIGTGAPVALGSLYSTPYLTARRRLGKALRAAERFCISVQGPFVIRSIKA